jgi:hypothetical protein
MNRTDIVAKWQRPAIVLAVFCLMLVAARGAPATTGLRLVAKQVNGITISIKELEAY